MLSYPKKATLTPEFLQDALVSEALELEAAQTQKQRLDELFDIMHTAVLYLKLAKMPIAISEFKPGAVRDGVLAIKIAASNFKRIQSPQHNVAVMTKILGDTLGLVLYLVTNVEGTNVMDWLADQTARVRRRVRTAEVSLDQGLSMKEAWNKAKRAEVL